MGLENPIHILILVVVILLVFGAKRLPEIGRSLGTGMREFKDSVTGGDSHKPTLSASAAQEQQPAQQQAPAVQAPVPPPPAPAPPAPAGDAPAPQAPAPAASPAEPQHQG